MTDELSARARAILDAAEQLAGGRSPSPPSPPSPPVASTEATADQAAQLAALAEQVRLIVEAMRARMQELEARVDTLAAELARRQAAAAAPPPGMPPRVVEPPPPPLPAPGPDDQPRLLAVELAVAGATRADVDARLRERFGVTSTALLLDEVFGIGSAPGARLAWGRPS